MWRVSSGGGVPGAEAPAMDRIARAEIAKKVFINAYCSSKRASWRDYDGGPIPAYFFFAFSTKSASFFRPSIGLSLL